MNCCNGTPNYGCPCIPAKPAPGCGAPDLGWLVDEAKQIAANKANIDCLADKLAGKLDRCEFEKHLMDPRAHRELFELCRQCGCEADLKKIWAALRDRYTKEEVDGLLAEKAGTTPPVYHELPLADGIEGGGKYCIGNDGLVHFSFVCQRAGGLDFEQEMLIATMPEGFCPRGWLYVPVMRTTVSYVLDPWILRITETGEMRAIQPTQRSESTVGDIYLRGTGTYYI